jgi:hypothetical protein
MSGAAASVPRGAATRRTKAIPRVIIDTALSRWWDDVTAIGLANVLHERAGSDAGRRFRCQNRVAVAAIDAIDLPRMVTDAHPGRRRPHSDADAFPTRLHRQAGPPASTRSTTATTCPVLFPSTVVCWRNKPDHSVTIIVARRIHQPGRLCCVREAVTAAPSAGGHWSQRGRERLVIMDGLFPGGGPAFTNQKIDLASAKRWSAARHGRHRLPGLTGSAGSDPSRRNAVHNRAAQTSDAHRLRSALRLRTAQGR